MCGSSAVEERCGAYVARRTVAAMCCSVCRHGRQSRPKPGCVPPTVLCAASGSTTVQHGIPLRH
eukprot:4536814-Alexandrium_andersonii.AAC.1